MDCFIFMHNVSVWVQLMIKGGEDAGEDFFPCYAIIHSPGATTFGILPTCYSSLFYKRTPRHVRNPLSFQVSPRAKQYQTKSPARSAISLHTAIAFKDAPEPEGRRRGN